MHPVILIPAYEPTELLLETVSGLNAVGFDRFVVIDDGSGPQMQAIFQKAAQMPGVTVLSHAVNCGKGRAMKTGFHYILTHFPDTIGTITCDCDGQHPAKAVLDCAAALQAHPHHLILGCRTFFHPSEKKVPFWNLVGNMLSRYLIGFACGTVYSDVQCGLRGYPPDVMRALLNVPGERFEFENNTFPALRRVGIPVFEFTMDAVYPAQNHSTHFKKVRDTFRIQRSLAPYYMPIVWMQLAALFLIWLFHPPLPLTWVAPVAYLLIYLLATPLCRLYMAPILGLGQTLILLALRQCMSFPAAILLTALLCLLPAHRLMLWIRYGKRPATQKS